MGEAKRRMLAGSALNPPFRGNLKAMPEMRLENPLVVMFLNETGAVTTHIHPAHGYSHKHYGLIICDLVRHVARAYHVDEDDVWEWVEKERDRPTTEITNPS